MPLELAKGVLPVMIKSLIELSSLHATSTQPAPSAETCRVLLRMMARGHHVMSVLLERDASFVPPLLASGLLPSLVDQASLHANEDRYRCSLSNFPPMICRHLLEMLLFHQTGALSVVLILMFVHDASIFEGNSLFEWIGSFLT